MVIAHVCCSLFSHRHFNLSSLQESVCHKNETSRRPFTASLRGKKKMKERTREGKSQQCEETLLQQSRLLAHRAGLSWGESPSLPGHRHMGTGTILAQIARVCPLPPQAGRQGVGTRLPAPSLSLCPLPPPRGGGRWGSPRGKRGPWTWLPARRSRWAGIVPFSQNPCHASPLLSVPRYANPSASPAQFFAPERRSRGGVCGQRGRAAPLTQRSWPRPSCPSHDGRPRYWRSPAASSLCPRLLLG